MRIANESGKQLPFSEILTATATSDSMDFGNNTQGYAPIGHNIISAGR